MRALAMRLLIVAVAGFLLSAPAVAQSASDLVARNIAARGGAEKLAAIRSLRLSGKLTFGGTFELTYAELRMRKDAAVRYDSSIQGLTLVQAYDGRVGWRINPFEGRRDAERMSADETGALADDGTIDGVLVTAKEKDNAITYVGREDFDGTDAYKLRVSLPNGAEYMDYLDPDTFLEIKIVETRLLRGARQVTLTELGDYELVNGVYFPFEIESGGLNSDPSGRQKITIESAQANVAVGDSTFVMPAAPSSK